MGWLPPTQARGKGCARAQTLSPTQAQVKRLVGIWRGEQPFRNMRSERSVLRLRSPLDFGGGVLLGGYTNPP